MSSLPFSLGPLILAMCTCRAALRDYCCCTAQGGDTETVQAPLRRTRESRTMVVFPVLLVLFVMACLPPRGGVKCCYVLREGADCNSCRYNHHSCSRFSALEVPSPTIVLLSYNCSRASSFDVNTSGWHAHVRTPVSKHGLHRRMIFCVAPLDSSLVLV